MKPRVQVLDFSLMFPRLRNRKRYRRFNNSIVHFVGNFYLMTYRLFYSYGKGDPTFKDEARRHHPWSSNWSSQEDRTILAVLHYDSNKHDFSIVREMTISYPGRIKLFDQNVDDARIVKLAGKFYIYGQAWVDSYSKLADLVVKEAGPKANSTKCLIKKRNCQAVVTILNQLSFPSLDSNKLPTRASVVSALLPCLHLPKMNRIFGDLAIEKNWCFFQAQGKIWFEYMLHPHIVIALDCHKSYETPSPFSQFKKSLRGGSFFSPGGPLSRWDDHHLLGVGHVKYDFDEIELLKLPSKNHLYMHAAYVYGMFFYLVENKPPFRITAYSHAFLPRYKGQKYALVFPMGAVPLKDSQDTWAISYGEGDDTPNVLYVSRKQIQNRLLTYDKSKKPKPFTVTWWDSEKI